MACDDNKRICAGMYSRQSDRVKRILNSIQEANLTADELGDIMIITGLYRMIKIDEEETSNIVKFPTIANM